MKEIVFCPECRQDVGFLVKEKSDFTKLRGTAYEFIAKTAYCNECGAEVHVPKIEDENLKSLYSTYRQKRNIVSP